MRGVKQLAPGLRHGGGGRQQTSYDRSERTHGSPRATQPGRDPRRLEVWPGQRRVVHPDRVQHCQRSATLIWRNASPSGSPCSQWACPGVAEPKATSAAGTRRCRPSSSPPLLHSLSAAEWCDRRSWHRRSARISHVLDPRQYGCAWVDLEGGCRRHFTRDDWCCKSVGRWWPRGVWPRVKAGECHEHHSSANPV